MIHQAAPSHAVAVDRRSHPINSMEPPGMSSVFLSGPPVPPRDFDHHLREAWVELTNKHFQSAEHVAVFFGVSEKAARNWREGVTGPRGGPVALAIKSIPGAAQMLLGA